MLFRLIALLAVCLLSSCIDCHEEIWLEADGSGHADVCYTLPAEAAKLQGGEVGVRRLLGKFLADTKELKSSSYEVNRDKDRLKIRVRAAFDSALDLKEISAGGPMDKLPSSASNLAGKVAVTVRGRTVDLTRTISPGAALPGSTFMPASSFDGHRLVYIIHLPMAATESNATRVEDNGRKLVWDFPLAEAIRTPVTTHFKADVPIPFWMIVAATVAIFSLGWLVLGGIRRYSKKSRINEVDRTNT
ncbi:MAG: hypothetical protein ABI600_12680 [Luteolibacter sp.]